MTPFLRRSVILVPALVVALGAFGGCSEIGIAIDCDELCRNLETCVDSDLDVSDCAEKCREDADDDQALEDAVDACTDCLDRDYSCSEIPARCPECRSLSDRLLGVTPEPPPGDAGAPEAGEPPPLEAGGDGR